VVERSLSMAKYVLRACVQHKMDTQLRLMAIWINFCWARSTKEYYCHPLPKFGNDCQPASAHLLFSYNFFKQFFKCQYFTILQVSIFYNSKSVKILQFYKCQNFAIFKLRSTTEQMPALIDDWLGFATLERSFLFEESILAVKEKSKTKQSK
jgi:hypothetical protein